jgi:hypothetical protein
MVSQHPGMYQDMLTVHRLGHIGAGNTSRIVKMLFVDFQLRCHHRLRDEQEAGCNVPRDLP